MGLFSKIGQTRGSAPTLMSFKNLVQKIATHPDIIAKPPVLIDIGASGELNPQWRHIAPFSIGIAFDADSREFGYIEGANSQFKKLYVINKIVTDAVSPQITEGGNTADFYLTKSPYCSSLLPPDTDSLARYHFSEAFSVEKKLQLPVIALQKALTDIGIDRIDWFKSDCQGVDLRLFRSLQSGIRERAIVVEFEPGFIDAYVGEDKMSDTLAFMEGQHFTLTKFVVKGPMQTQAASFKQVFTSNFTQKLAKNVARGVPGWAELGYINSADDPFFGEREYLLAWLFATAQDHHDVALSYVEKAQKRFNALIFNDLKQHSQQQLKGEVFSLRHLPKLFKLFLKR
jgi:hypothetical protein